MHFFRPNGVSIEDLSKETLALEAMQWISIGNKKKTTMDEIFCGHNQSRWRCIWVNIGRIVNFVNHIDLKTSKLSRGIIVWRMAQCHATWNRFYSK